MLKLIEPGTRLYLLLVVMWIVICVWAFKYHSDTLNKIKVEPLIIKEKAVAQVATECSQQQLETALEKIFDEVVKHPTLTIDHKVTGKKYIYQLNEIKG